MFTWLSETLMGKVLTTIFVSMVPIIELRGAIPIGVGLGLDLVPTILLCIIGNMIPVPFIILFIRRIFQWMRKLSPKLNSLVVKMEEKAYSKKDIIDKYKILGLYVLVAIPLPGTGAWTGSLVAAIFDIRLKYAFPVIFAGVATAGLIIGLVTGGVVALF